MAFHDGIFANFIDFDTAFTATMQEARMAWDADSGTLQIGMPGGNVNLQVGQEHIIRCRNETGSTITNGSLVYITGASGNKPTIALADADAEATADSTIGMATEDIANNSNGYVCERGIVRDLNTLAYAEGTKLYLSQTAGAFTNTAPASPAHAVIIGIVTKQHATQGEILLNIHVGSDLASLHDLNFTSLANNDIIKYDSGNGYWINSNTASLSTITISSFTAGSVVFAGTGGLLSQDNSNFFWDDTNNRLGIGTASPELSLDVNGGIMTANSISGGYYIERSDGTNAQVLLLDSSAPNNLYLGSTDIAGDLYFQNATSPFTHAAYLASGNWIFGAITSGGGQVNILDTSEQLRLSYDASNYTTLHTGSGGDLTIIPSGGDVTIGQSGVSGIGSLTVQNQNSSYVCGDGSSGYADFTLTGTYFESRVLLNSGSTAYNQIVSDTGLIFKTNTSTSAVTVDTSGNVGIGAPSPSTLLHLKYTSAGNDWLTIESTDSGGTTQGGLRLKAYGITTGWDIYTGSTANNSNALGIRYNGASDFISVNTSGNVGIGAPSPGAKLHSLATTEQLRLGYDASNYTSFTVDSSGNITLSPINTNPNVLIGTTSKTSSSLALLSNSTTGSAGIYFNDGSSSGSLAYSHQFDVLDVTVGGGFVQRWYTGGAGRAFALNNNDYISAFHATSGWVDLIKANTSNSIVIGSDDIVVDTSGNVGIGTTTSPTGTATKVLFFGDNTANPTMGTNTAGIFAKDVSGTVEMFAIDEASNATQLSSHNPETGEWRFYSENVKTGRIVEVDLESFFKHYDDANGTNFFNENKPLTPIEK